MLKGEISKKARRRMILFLEVAGECRSISEACQRVANKLDVSGQAVYQSLKNQVLPVADSGFMAVWDRLKATDAELSKDRGQLPDPTTTAPETELERRARLFIQAAYQAESIEAACGWVAEQIGAERHEIEQQLREKMLPLQDTDFAAAWNRVRRKELMAAKAAQKTEAKDDRAAVPENSEREAVDDDSGMEKQAENEMQFLTKGERIRQVLDSFREISETSDELAEIIGSIASGLGLAPSTTRQYLVAGLREHDEPELQNRYEELRGGWKPDQPTQAEKIQLVLEAFQNHGQSAEDLQGAVGGIMEEFGLAESTVREYLRVGLRDANDPELNELFALLKQGPAPEGREPAEAETPTGDSGPKATPGASEELAELFVELAPEAQSLVSACAEVGAKLGVTGRSVEAKLYAHLPHATERFQNAWEEVRQRGLRRKGGAGQKEDPRESAEAKVLEAFWDVAPEAESFDSMLSAVTQASGLAESTTRVYLLRAIRMAGGKEAKRLYDDLLHGTQGPSPDQESVSGDGSGEALPEIQDSGEQREPGSVGAPAVRANEGADILRLLAETVERNPDGLGQKLADSIALLQWGDRPAPSAQSIAAALIEVIEANSRGLGLRLARAIASLQASDSAGRPRPRGPDPSAPFSAREVVAALKTVQRNLDALQETRALADQFEAGVAHRLAELGLDIVGTHISWWRRFLNRLVYWRAPAEVAAGEETRTT